MIGPNEWVVLLFALILLYILKRMLFGKKKESVTPSQQVPPQVSQQQSTSVSSPININIENVVRESKETTAEEAKSFGTCPKCDGKLSELSYYKLKSGESTECEFCGERLSGQ